MLLRRAGRVVGTADAQRNVISGNSRGVGIGDAPGNVVQGNHIGTDPSGTIGVGNTVNGVVIGSSGNTIADNVISDSPSFGVVLTGAAATGNLIQGNKIGTDAAGTATSPSRRWPPAPCAKLPTAKNLCAGRKSRRV